MTIDEHVRDWTKGCAKEGKRALHLLSDWKVWIRERCKEDSQEFDQLNLNLQGAIHDN